MLLNALSKLEEWRHLPAYQLERRVDVFFGLFLPEIIEQRFREPGGVVIPEFPLHRGNVLRESNSKRKNESVKVDFAVFCRNRYKKIFLVELKTDSRSIRPDQLKHMLCAARDDVGPEQVLGGVVKAAIHSPVKPKYGHLLYELHKLGCVARRYCKDNKGAKNFDQIDMNKTSPGLEPTFRDLDVSVNWKNAAIELVLIAPSDVRQKGHVELSRFHHITLADVANAIEDECKSRLELAHYLRRWEETKAGRAQLAPRA